MTLGDLRAGLVVTSQALAHRARIGLPALASLEATQIERVTVGALREYAAGLGASVDVVFPDGRRVTL